MAEKRPGTSSRREFLQGRSAVRTLAEAIQSHAAEAASVPGAGTVTGETYLVRVSRRAMACQFEVLFNAGQYDDVSTKGVEALQRVAELEEQLSFFRPESELNRINRQAALEPVEVEPGLFGLLELALRLSEETAGAFDITAAPLWEAWGFARRAGRVPSPEALAKARQNVGSHLVELDPARRTVRFRRPGVRLNLGALGKGYALDRAADVLQSAGVGHFLFHAGQSSVLACGHRGIGPDPSAPDGPGWTVGVRHPLWPQRRWAELRLCDRALGTSAPTFQSFCHQGTRYHHILDPRTGQPAQGTLAVTVVAQTATLADALSTALFVMGPEAALAYCQAHPEIAALMVVEGRRPGQCEVHAAGFGPNELQFDPTRV